ncbi:hypothetical protein MJK72_07205 [Klebsiella pneumoniae]|nr:hypothetical protein MJK72_07205 [Klebsiella pneumoniae]
MCIPEASKVSLAGATQERTQKVLEEMTNYHLTKEKDNVESGVSAVGESVSGFAGCGQNNLVSVRSFR